MCLPDKIYINKIKIKKTLSKNAVIVYNIEEWEFCNYRGTEQI